MLNVEKNFLQWIEKRLYIIVGILFSLLAIYLRITLRNFSSNDAVVHLLPWYEEIKNNGGILSLNKQVGNYNMLYQFFIAIMTYLPIEPLYAYKGLSCMFDFALALLVAFMTYSLTNKNKLCGVVAYGVVLFSPIVFLNSAMWAQCDSIYVFFCVLFIWLLVREHFWPAFFCLGLAFSFKLQAVFILPFAMYIYFAKRKFSILNFGMIPAALVVTGLPGILMGRKWTEVFTIYLNQTENFPLMALNYPSFWVILNDATVEESYYWMKTAVLIFTIVALAITMIIFYIKRVELNPNNMIYIAFILTYMCVLFLPSMHERYGYLYEILAILIAFLNKKTIPCCVTITLLTLMVYGKYLFSSAGISLAVLSLVNACVFICYLRILSKNMVLEDAA